MSSSTVRLLKLPSIDALSACCSIGGEIAASVVTTAIIVASCGAIIPEPLQIAESVTWRRLSEIVREATFIRVSVVRIASAAASGAGVSAATRLGSAARIFSFGSRTPITPVEAESTVPAPPVSLSASAVASATICTSSTPAAPVSAFALPLLMITAWTPADGTRDAASITGAARAVFAVRQAAALHGVALKTRARSFLLGLMPACSPAN